jgi:uncharacterized membrane protein
MSLLRPLSLGLATLTTGLVAGFFYAYACSVTLGTARLDDAGYIATMQAINATVRNAVFAFSFFGALVALVVALAVHLRSGWTVSTQLVALALVLYAVGGFGLTMAISVPLNEDLAEVSLDAPPETLAQARQDYEGDWNLWNGVRTAFSTAAFLALIAGPLVRVRRPVAAADTQRRASVAIDHPAARDA